MSRRDRSRTIRPRFILFVVSVFILLISVMLLVVAIVYGSSFCTAVKCGRAPDSLTLGSTVLDTGDAPTAPPAMTTTGSTEAAVIAGPPALPDGVTFAVTPIDAARPASFGFTYDIRRNNREETYSSNPAETAFSFGKAESYSSVEGITTFAGNHYRNSFSYGTAIVSMQTLTEKWSVAIGSLESFSGVSWTGQPLIVAWSGDVLSTLGVTEAFRRAERLVEVIQCAADGNIYFYEYATGQKTREPIRLGVPLFGTPTLDPRGVPMLYIGQGTAYETNKSACYAVNLVNNSFQTVISGKDHTARRDDWSAFDASPLIIEDTLVWPSENGLLYLVKLNTAYDAQTGSLSINPGDKIKYRYSGSGYSTGGAADKRWYGFESSVTAFRNYLYLADNGGRLQCVDLNTLKLQFVVDLGGDTDASVVLEEDGAAGTVWLYTCSQTAEQDESLPAGYGFCYTKKINGLTGQVLWEQKQAVITVGGAKGGSKATPHIGQGTIGDLLICSYYGLAVDTANDDGSVSYGYGGKIVAYDRATGQVRWEIKQLGEGDFVSSPLVVYTDRQNAYLIACDRAGAIKLYNAQNPGENALFALSLGARIDATPIAYNGYLYVATTGTGSQTRLYCLQLQ